MRTCLHSITAIAIAAIAITAIFGTSIVVAAIIIVAGLAIPRPALAQSPLVWERWGAVDARLGTSLEPAGDANGDGIPDLIYGAPGRAGDSFERGRLEIVSGADGALIRTITTESEFRRSFGDGLEVIGDLDSDGEGDVLIFMQRTMEARSIADGSLIHRIHYDDFVTNGDFVGDIGTLGDVNGDGLPDFFRSAKDFAGEEMIYSQGHVVCFSGADATVLWELRGLRRDDFLGETAVNVGDATGDGIDDLVIGQPGRQAATHFDAVRGSILLVDGSNGRILDRHTMSAQYRDFGGGGDIAVLGDIDGNGKTKIVVAARLAMLHWRVNYGWIGVFEVPGFELKYERWGTEPERIGASQGEELGYRLVTVGDVDGDGIQDFLASTNREVRARARDRPGRMYLLSGKDGHLLQVYEGLMDRENGIAPYFYYPSALGDIDGDGVPEFACGTLRHPEDSEDRGVVQVYRYEYEKTAFFRGDANRDGRFNISDAVEILRVLFAGLDPGGCLAAFDSRNDGEIDVIDALNIATYLFQDHGIPPEPPFLECGRYGRVTAWPGLPELPCEEFDACPQ